MITKKRMLFLVTFFFSFSLQASSLKNNSLAKNSKESPLALAISEVVKKYEIAQFYYNFEKYDLAKREYQEVLELSRERFGNDHRLTKAILEKKNIFESSSYRFNSAGRLHNYLHSTSLELQLDPLQQSSKI